MYSLCLFLFRFCISNFRICFEEGNSLFMLVHYDVDLLQNSIKFVIFSLSVFLSQRWMPIAFYMSLYLSVNLSVYLSVYLSVHLSVCLSICLYVNLSVNLSVFLSLYIYVYQSFSVYFPLKLFLIYQTFRRYAETDLKLTITILKYFFYNSLPLPNLCKYSNQ